MQIQYSSQTINAADFDVIVVGVNDKQFSQNLQQLDEQSAGFFTRQQQLGNFPDKAGEIRVFHGVNEIASRAVMVVALNAEKANWIAVHQKIISKCREYMFNNVASTLLFEEIDVPAIIQARLAAQNLLDTDYICEEFKSEKKNRSELTITLFAKDSEHIGTGIKQGIAIAEGMNKLKDLGNAPGNVCTPKYLAKTANLMAKQFANLEVEVLKENAIRKLGMESLLSVSKGSELGPRLIVMQYQGGQEGEAPIALVGKGVTFDTGGISLKPGAGMDEMKYDMCGAGSVIGVMHTIASLELPINVVGVIPAVENMPSGHASKPGDIVTSMSGKTIEILNTDAEGRLILCDALTYSQQFNPKMVVDIATLTGAVIIALGNEASGVMSNDDELAQLLIDAGEKSTDRTWQLPLWEAYAKQLESPFADLQNISNGRGAGTITAGCFLAEFTKDVRWAHLDIAGVAWKSGKDKGATGRPVPLLSEFILSQVPKTTCTN